MYKYEKPLLIVEKFITDDIFTDSTVINDNNIKIAVPKGKESALKMLKS